MRRRSAPSYCRRSFAVDLSEEAVFVDRFGDRLFRCAEP